MTEWILPLIMLGLLIPFAAIVIGGLRRRLHKYRLTKIMADPEKARRMGYRV